MKKFISILLVFTLIFSMLPLTISSVSATETKSSDTCILGDADADGKITVKDSTMIQLYLVEVITLDEKQQYIANCDGSDGVQISDATTIQMYLADMETEYKANADGYVIGDLVTFEEDNTTEPTTKPTTQPTTVPVTDPPKTTQTITVGVISYVYDETSSQTSSYAVHYWNDAGLSGDAVCTSLGTTESRSVGSEYWSNSAQTFKMYSAEIPLEATGFKFHIADRWFGDDGNTATNNAVYIFNYSGDKALYTKVNIPDPTEPIVTTPTTPNPTNPPTPTTPSDEKTIKVGVISYVYDETSSQTSSYTLHYWSDSGLSGDVVCTSLGTTESRSVGSEYWGNASQTFRMYSAVIPADATGFKFHIADRWFGDDGNATTQNAVYIFNYSGDKAIYTTVTSPDPTVPVTTQPTTQPTTTKPVETTPTTPIPTTPATLGLNYQFSGSNAGTAGYAEGTVSLTTDTAGTYYLYWADDTKALDGYYEITSMSLSANGTGTFKFSYHTAIPAGATRLIATTSKSSLTVANAKAEYVLPESKRLTTGSGDLKYTFSSYSDVHIDPDGYYKNYETKFTQALNYANKKGTDFIVSSGDMVNFGLDSEWEIYERILSQSNYNNPVYESNGNHDLRSNIDNGRKSFVRATGTDNTTANYDANKPYYYVTEKTTGDMFIFMALEGDYKTHTVDSFTQEQINWLTNLLSKYYNTGINIYIIEHAAIEGFGAGDRMDNPLYKSHLSQSFTSTQQFKALLQKYPKLIWMSGHTHIDYELGYNYSNENGTACHMIHNSAVIGSTKADSSNSALDYNDGNGYNSQGYYVEVYNNQVVYYGANLTDEKIYPAYCYIMDGSRNIGNAGTTTPEQFTGSSSTSLSSALATAKTTLDNMYTFSSYDQYQAVKKLYNQYKGSTSVSNQSTVVAEIEARIAELKAIASHIGYSEPLDTYYFVNKLGWSTVYGYAWTGSSNNATWPGKALEKVGTYSGYGVYEIKFSSAGQYANLIFSDGTNQTVDIALASYGNNAFMANNTTENGKHTITNLKYTPSGNSKYVLRYYNTGYHTWDDIDTYLTENGDGTYVYEMTTVNSEDISCNVYNTIKSEYNCVSASETLNYSSGASNTYNLSASSSRGKSITIKGLSAGKKITFIYTAATKTLKITCG